MKTVITYGVFDLFHEGHVNLLKRAKELGDRLIVGVTSNEFTKQRGKLLLADSLDIRMTNVRNCPYVDEVILEDHYGQKVEDIQKYKADVFVIGDDWKGKFDYLKKWCEVVYLPRTPGISSSSLRTAPYPEISFGIVGSGRIAQRFLNEIKTVHGGVHAEHVYNPNKESAERLAAEHPELTVYGSYDDMLDNCKAVYIASPHETHYAYAKKALLQGKHVLCEKPLALKESEARELYTIAEERSLVLMEAIKTAYCPGFSRLLSLVGTGFIGEVRDVECAFSKLTSPKLRERTDREYGGSFTELASYTLLPVIKLLGCKDLSIRFESQLDENGIDLYTKTYISNGKVFSCGKNGLGVKTEGELVIAGTGGYIRVDAPWWKTSRFSIHHEDPQDVQTFQVDFAGDGLRYEIAEFVDRLQGWHTSDYHLTKEESIKIASIFEQYLEYRKELRNK